MGMQRVIVSMPDELVAAIDKAAKERDRSRSWMIRRAAESFIEDEELRGEPKVTFSVAPHGFVPQPQNALRCQHCGLLRREHPKESA